MNHAANTKRLQRQLLEMLGRLDLSRAQLREDALQGTSGEGSGELSHVPTHLADMGNFEADESVTLGLLQNEEHLITEIEHALDRIDHGTFGTCTSCRKAIAANRLRAIPYAQHCVDCARKYQDRDKR